MKPGRAIEVPSNNRGINIPATINSWNFCPLCGTPKPNEKTLAEKFNEFYQGAHGGCCDYTKWLVKIAQEHFHPKDQEKT